MAQTHTGEGAGTNVLDVLDQRQPTAFYWKLTILACLGGFLFGYDTSNIGAALNFVPYHLSSFWLGYLVAGASLGAAAGAGTGPGSLVSTEVTVSGAMYLSLGLWCFARNRKNSAVAITMNAPYGRANVMTDPPKYIAGPSARGSADTSGLQPQRT